MKPSRMVKGKVDPESGGMEPFKKAARASEWPKNYNDFVLSLYHIYGILYYCMWRFIDTMLIPWHEDLMI